jgi:hypothetical protein
MPEYVQARAIISMEADYGFKWGQMSSSSTSRIDLSQREILAFVVDCLSIMTSQRTRSCAPMCPFFESHFEPEI